MLHEYVSYPSDQTEIADENLEMTGRLTPIGGSSSDTEYNNLVNEECDEKTALLQEHEKLNASLTALTCHFAHVQLRLQQVISAPTPEDRENLLMELHKFASSGIPDVMCQPSIFNSELTNEQLIEAEKRREKACIDELKQKLDELEHYALASGSLEGAPTSVMIEKQRILIDELREKLALQLDDDVVSKLSADELRKLVDQGIQQIISPVKVKEKLISQMRTEIGDLENFIEFLKADSAAKITTDNTVASIPPSTSSDVEVPLTTQSKPLTTKPSATPQSKDSYSSCFPFGNRPANLSQTIKRIFILTQLYTFFLLTCGRKSKNKPFNQSSTSLSKKDLISNHHYGDLRAKLELAIEKVLRSIRSSNIPSRYLNDDPTSDSESDSEDFENTYTSSAAVVSAVRQELGPALQALLEHGLSETNYSSSLSLWGCCSLGSVSHHTSKSESLHIWELFLKYFHAKHGDDFVNSPARKLSQSFDLNIIGGQPITLTQCLLIAIDTVVKLHKKHPKQMDWCFKSFICYALNEKKLVPFLRLIVQAPALVENYYQSWSYTKRTGFNDALHSLDRLTSIDFDLPINASIRRFINNRDLIE